MFKRSAKGWWKHWDFILMDCLSLLAALFLAYFLRYGSTAIQRLRLDRGFLILVILLDYVVLLLMDTLKNVLRRGYMKELAATVRQMIVLYLCIVAYLFAVKESAKHSRIIIVSMLLIYGAVTYLIRILWKHILRSKMSHREGNALLIIADKEHISEMVHVVESNNYNRYRLVGVTTLENTPVGTKIGDVEVVATLDDILDFAQTNWVDEVLVSLKANEPMPDNIIDTLLSMGITVHINIDPSAGRNGVKQVMSDIGGIRVITNTMNYMNPRQAICKRAMDILGGLVGCLITLLLCIFIGPAIKKESPGPLFFTQDRVGKNGRIFKMYKFRSMYLDAEERKKELMEQNRIKDGLMFKMEFDPRVIGNRIDENGNQVTGIGEFIRKYSLDEFPQFFNVLKGDMSLVGTRPPLLDEYNAYSAHHKARLGTKPGITGMWQVSGRSDILDFEEVVKLDTEYINNWSLGLDIKILFKTIAVVFKKDGAM